MVGIQLRKKRHECLIASLCQRQRIAGEDTREIEEIVSEIEGQGLPWQT